jgi:hypothetical protein
VVDDIFLDNIGGQGVYDIKANIDEVDGQDVNIGPVDAGGLIVRSPGESDIKVSSIEGPGESQVPGDEFVVTAKITNEGTVSGERTFDVYIDASKSTEITAQLDSGQTKTYEVKITAPDKDQVTVRVGEMSVSVDILQGSELQPSMSVEKIWDPSGTPAPGDDVVLKAKIKNSGSAGGETNYDIVVNGSKVGSLKKNVPAGTTKYFDVSIKTPQAETVTVKIGSKETSFSTSYSPGDGGSREPTGDELVDKVMSFVNDNKLAIGAAGAGAAYLLSRGGNTTVIGRTGTRQSRR